VSNEKITDILEKLFTEQNVEVTVLDRKIVIYPAELNQVQQQSQVTGRVTDQNGNPLPGVTVVVKGTSSGTVTDVSGYFKLTGIAPDATLQFSFVGMRSVELNVAGRGVINVNMTEEAVGIEEVVAVGYGTQKKVNLTGSVTTISTEDMGYRPFSSTSLALQGVTSGVTVTNRSGAPGSTGTIRIRGIGTLNDSDPLILIDGVEGDLNVIDPNVIESITVLKDAASSAIYGSRAANGVILVTTKRANSETM